MSSDPPPNPDPRQPPVISAVGEPPFFLYCNFCRWDSAEAGITFDKPTGLARKHHYYHICEHSPTDLTVQLQKTEDSSADSLEFERLKDHFEPLVRASQGQAAAPAGAGNASARPTPLSAINAAASSALNRDVPGLRRKGHDAIPKGVVAKDEFSSTYKSRIDSAAGGVLTQSEIDWIRDMTQEEFVLGDVAKVEQRWLGSWAQSLKASCVFMPYIVALLLELMVPIQ